MGQGQGSVGEEKRSTPTEAPVYRWVYDSRSGMVKVGTLPSP